MQVDSQTHNRYLREAPELIDAVVSSTAEAGDISVVMRRDAHTDYCVKFDNGLCGIQQKYGTDFLGEACHFYPRVTRSLGNTLTMTATLSCPEIARLSLFGDAPFATETSSLERLPYNLQDYLPEHLNAEQALAIHHRFLDAALDENASPERTLMRIFSASESLMRISADKWLDAVPFYLDNADSTLPAPEYRETDLTYLLQALCGLVAAAKKVGDKRLMQTIGEMEKALHVAIPLDTLAIAAQPDSLHASKMLYERWQNEWRNLYTPLLRRYLTMQLSLALFPFAGFGNTLTQRIAIIGVRFATVKLALMSACAQSASLLGEADIIRVIQSLSRFLDHLAEPEFSIRIYQETGWLQKRRLRAIVGDE